MAENIPADFYRRRDGLSATAYQSLYQQSCQDPAGFWAKQASIIDFYQPWHSVVTGDFSQGESRWFNGATLNACYNCIDRHLPHHGESLALIWQGDEPAHSLQLTYRQLHEKVCRLANVLKGAGIGKGDRVGIYLPMIPEAVVAMLACARIGAVHCVIFAGFSAEALANRLQDISCRLVITADSSVRGGKTHLLKQQVDQALSTCPLVTTVLVVAAANSTSSLRVAGRDSDYEIACRAASPVCACTEMAAVDPLFILHTSGSTGKPKGIVHATAGYLVYSALSFQLLFDYQPGEVHWCTADVGWITGHSYSVYGPLANRATVLIFEGIPTYPDASRCWQIIDQHQVAIFYTAPTAIRALMREGDAWLATSSRSSLRLLGSVGEPINPLVWWWYFEKVGNQRCPIIDTWWQTETGGILIAPIIGITPLKPGSAGSAFLGIQPAVLDDQGQSAPTDSNGNLVIKQPWPGLMLTIYGDHRRCIDNYFGALKGVYFTGDGAKCDQEHDYWLTGRIDDVLNCSGHRIGTAEIESALVSNASIAEAAVVGFPHPIKGQGIYAFVTPKAGVVPTLALQQALMQTVATLIGAIAKPDLIQFAPALPKTRSGKIMRRLLKQIAAQGIATQGIAAEESDFGDVSTLADPTVLSQLLANRQTL